MSAPRYTYLISRNLDPVFALFVGVAAAAQRVSREEKEKGRSTDETVASLKRRVGSLFSSDAGEVAAKLELKEAEAKVQALGEGKR